MAQTGCVRSNKAYAPAVASQIGKNLHVSNRSVARLDFVACTGALLRGRPNGPYPRHFAQQLAEVGQRKYDLITLTIGGNDIGFADVITGCLVGIVRHPLSNRKCSYNPQEVELKIDGLAVQLAEDYSKKLEPKLAPGGQIIVLGYPLLFSNPSQWAGVLHKCKTFSQEDARDLNRLGERLTARIGQAVRDVGRKYGNIHFIDVQKGVGDTAGWDEHGLCSSHGDEWLNGVTFPKYVDDDGNVRKRVEGSFHPNAAGHAGEAKMLAAELKGLDWSHLQDVHVRLARGAFGVAESGTWRTRLELGRSSLFPIGSVALSLVIAEVAGGPRFETDATIDAACGSSDYSAAYWDEDAGGGKSRPAFGVLLKGDTPVGYRLYSGSAKYSVGDQWPIGSAFPSWLPLSPTERVLQREVTVGGQQRTEFEIRDMSVPPQVGPAGPQWGTAVGSKVVARGEGEQCGLDGSVEMSSQTRRVKRTDRRQHGALPPGRYHLAVAPEPERGFCAGYRDDGVRMCYWLPSWSGTGTLEPDGTFSGTLNGEAFDRGAPLISCRPETDRPGDLGRLIVWTYTQHGTISGRLAANRVALTPKLGRPVGKSVDDPPQPFCGRGLDHAYEQAALERSQRIMGALNRAFDVPVTWTNQATAVTARVSVDGVSYEFRIQK